MNTWDTLREGLQYGGKTGQWSWIAHRATGLATVAFIATHILDSTLLTFFPKLYQKTINLFKLPLAGLIEIGLIGAVLYHGVNGLRVAVMDFFPDLWRYHKKSNEIAQFVFAALFIPMALKMFISVLRHLGGEER